MFGLFLCHCLDTHSVAFAFQDFERWSIDNDLLVQVLRLAVATLVIEQVVKAIKFNLSRGLATLALLSFSKCLIALLNRLLALILFSRRLSK